MVGKVKSYVSVLAVLMVSLAFPAAVSANALVPINPDQVPTTAADFPNHDCDDLFGGGPYLDQDVWLFVIPINPAIGGDFVSVTLAFDTNADGTPDTTKVIPGDGGALLNFSVYGLTSKAYIVTPAGWTLTGGMAEITGEVERFNLTPTCPGIPVDTTDPSITYNLTPAPNAAGWNNTDVTVGFTCSDADSGVASCSSPVTLTTEGAGQSVMGTATDNAGNSADTTAVVNIDKTAPTAGAISMTGIVTLPILGTLLVGNSTDVSVPVSDALSGVVRVEYYFDTDPGVGNGVAMAYDGTTATADNVSVQGMRGLHTLYVRAIDAADNVTVVSRTSRRP